MTNEEAIEVLAQDLPCETDEDLVEAMAMAIKALETVSCIKEKCAYCPHCENCDVDDETLEIKALEQQPCADAVSRQAVDELSKELVHTTRDKADFLCNFWEGLQKLPPVILQPCEDCISRQDALNCVTSNEFRYRIVEDIKALPPVTPKEKTGHWIDDMGLGYHVSICSNCNWRGHGDTCLIYKPKFCPNCGAKMVESQESEDKE